MLWTLRVIEHVHAQGVTMIMQLDDLAGAVALIGESAAELLVRDL